MLRCALCIELHTSNRFGLRDADANVCVVSLLAAQPCRNSHLDARRGLEPCAACAACAVVGSV